MFELYADMQPAILGGILVLAFLVSTVLTPRFAEAALRFGIVDAPDGRLKTQRAPIPYLGGLAVATAVIAAVAVGYRLDQETLGIMFSSMIILLLGLMDDLRILTPVQKLTWQTFATVLLIRSGIYIKLTIIPYEWLQLGLTVLWVVGLSNAFNLIDIRDGLASSVATVCALGLAFFAYTSARWMVACSALALAGACLGFYVHNRQPARIYLGDTGSMFIGFLLAALSINNNYGRYNDVAVLAPVMVLGIPIFETSFVTVVRIIKGRHIFHGSPDHFPIRLQRAGLSVPAVVRVAAGAQAALVGVAVVLVYAPRAAAWAAAGVTALLAIVAAALLMRINVDQPR